MNKTYLDTCEGLGWAVCVSENGYVELEKTTPAGEDFCFSVESETFVDCIGEYAASFDQDEHVEMLIMAKQGGLSGVPSVRVLVKDAQDIEDMLHELADALSKVELQV